MRMTALLFVSVCCVAPMLYAQQAAMPVVSLKVTTRLEAPLSQPMAPMRSAACDDAGNVYAIQPFTRAEAHLPSVQEITPNARLAGNFRLPKAYPGNVRGGFVDHDGSVYMVVNSYGVYVVEFAPDGSAKARTRLEVGSSVEAWHLAVFKSGEYLLVGQSGKDLRTPFTAVFAADGRLVKKIYEPEDEEALQKAGAGDPKYVFLPNLGNRFVSSGDVAAGSDGNVYLLHGGFPTLVYVISPAGDVVRKLRFDAGNPDLVASSIKFHAGRLAIGFDSSGEGGVYVGGRKIKVIDIKGNSIADYEVVEDTVGEHSLFLACYDSEGFTMLPAHSGTELHLLKVKLP